MIKLSEFDIEGLFGKLNVRIPIRKNTLILVGENGQGKSTIVNILFYFLTAQWKKLIRFPFSKVSIIINDEPFSLKKLSLESYLSFRKDQEKDDSTVLSYVVKRVLKESDKGEVDLEQSAKKILEDFKLPQGMVDDVISEIQKLDLAGIKEIPELSNKLQNAIRDQIIFLPTYRRIEQDLTNLFPGISTDLKRIQNDDQKYENKKKTFVEFVRFGMEDVDTLINQKMEELKDGIRSRLNNLTATYLKDVIDGTYTELFKSFARQIEDDKIEEVFRRIQIGLLPHFDKEALKQKITKIKSKKRLGGIDKAVLHFFSKLFELQESQAKQEENVNNFIISCNNYLVGKKLFFDDSNFKINVLAIDQDGAPINSPIHFSLLSSGEKQVVSLFSHLFLSTFKTFFMIIDEPELSLSVKWQKRFLLDIRKSPNCSGLIAVTHSPFIFENSLDSFAGSIEEYSH